MLALGELGESCTEIQYYFHNFYGSLNLSQNESYGGGGEDVPMDTFCAESLPQ